jgi:hypothetical protein
VRGQKLANAKTRFSGRRAGVKKTLTCLGISPTIIGIELGRAVLTRYYGGRHAIAGYSPIVPTATSDHKYPTILGSESENVHRVELRIPRPTLPGRGEKWMYMIRNEQPNVDS